MFALNIMKVTKCGGFKCNLTLTLVKTGRYIIFVIFTILKEKQHFSVLFVRFVLFLFIYFFDTFLLKPLLHGTR